MQNISSRKESIKLRTGQSYYIIDLLYLTEIKERFSEINVDDLINEIRTKIFPDFSTVLGEFVATQPVFEVERIRKVYYSEVIKGDRSFFSTDTAVLIVANTKIFAKVISACDYYELTDHHIEIINPEVWQRVVSAFEDFDIGLISSPGINSGCDFNGSGTYQVA